jgi:hypothetical protein
MAISQADLDRGGTNRQFIRQYLGPSLGWVSVPAPAASIFAITAAGTYNINRSVTLITVAVSGGVILNLPRARQSPVPPAQPGLSVQTPIVIVDIGGFATANPITINPAAGETIMGLSSIQLTVNYGGYTLKPLDALPGWESISP